MRFRRTLLVAAMLVCMIGLASTSSRPSHAQSVTGFTGSVPARDSIGLLVTGRAIGGADLTLSLKASGCEVVALAVLRTGNWLVYLPGAPAQVNASFPEPLDAATPFFVRCGGFGEVGVSSDAPRSWEGNGRGSTGRFATDPGEWEYCGSIVANGDEHSGARFSLYTDAGLWVSSDSGKGGPGSVGCTPIPASTGSFEIRVFALDDLRWSITLRPQGAPSTAAELPHWDSAPTAITPSSVSEKGVAFESDSSEVTRLFRVPSSEWTFCWELVPSAADMTSGDPSLTITVLFEDEPGEVTHYEIPSTLLTVGGRGCIEVDARQPGRYRLLVSEHVPGAGWGIVVQNATPE